MYRITKADIIGARIVDVYSTFENLDGCDFTVIHFTVDRGYSFNMPIPGHLWKGTTIPPAAHGLPDESVSESYKVEGEWPSIRFIREPSTKNDVIRRIKQRTIQGVYCRKRDETLGFHEPDDSVLVFDDGSQEFCVTVAPHGTGATGLHYRCKPDELMVIDELADFFEGPLERPPSRQSD